LAIHKMTETEVPVAAERKFRPRELPLVVTEDDIRDLAQYKKYKQRSKPVSLNRLYISNEKARRANKREEKMYEEHKAILRKRFNIKLVKLEFQYKIEKASKLKYEEDQIIALRKKREDAKLRREAEILGLEKPQDQVLEDKQASKRVHYHGYESRPGTQYAGKEKKAGSNDVLRNNRIVAESWIREERIKAFRQEEVCRRLLKAERVIQRQTDKRVGHFQNGEWLQKCLDLDVDEELMDDSSSESFYESASSIASMLTEEERRKRNLNNIPDSFLRTFLKYDAAKPEEELGYYLERHDSPKIRNYIQSDDKLIRSFSRSQSRQSGQNQISRNSARSNSRGSLRRGSSFTSQVSYNAKDSDALFGFTKEKVVALPDIGQAFDTSRRTRYLRFPKMQQFERELSCAEILTEE